MSIDLHTHSTFSDGTSTPEELLAHAKEIGLQALALTDHDTCSGLPRAEKAAAEAGIPFVRGCELSTRTERGSFHILGLWLPEQTDVLEERLSALRRRRAERNEKIVERLCTLGLPLTMEDVLICAGQGTVGRPHIAQVMVQKGYVPDLRSAFTEYLGANGRAYVPKKVFSPEEAIRLLVSTGATVSLAHPCIHHYPSAWLFERIRMLAAVGLDAIEAWHTEHSPEDVAQCLAWADELGLGVSGGSDYHGKRKPGTHLGTGHGNVCVPYRVLQDLQERRRSKGLPVS